MGFLHVSQKVGPGLVSTSPLKINASIHNTFLLLRSRLYLHLSEILLDLIHWNRSALIVPTEYLLKTSLTTIG